MLGIVPGSAVYVAIGAFGTDPGSPPFLLAIAALVLLTVLGVWRQRRTRGAAPTDADPAPGPG